MSMEKTVFEKTYQHYLARFESLDFKILGKRLGLAADRDSITVPLYGTHYTIRKSGITDLSGSRASFDVCIILSKYLLLCPDIPPGGKEWMAFRDFKDSGPLTTYFDSEVENALAGYFSGKLDLLAQAVKSLKGRPPDIDATYDLSCQFKALSRIRVLLLFNDREEGFPATCSVLFERRAEHYLDAECLAVTGRLLFTLLKQAAARQTTAL